MDDSTFINYLIWEVTHDQEYLELYADKIEPESFENPETIWLLESTVTYWRTYGELLDADVLEMMLAEKPDTSKFDKDTVRELYSDAPEPPESLVVFLYDYTAEWLKKRGFLSMLSDAAEALSSGQVDAARELVRGELDVLYNTVEEFETVDAFGDVAGNLESIAAMWADQEHALKTGIPSVDAVMRGGLMPGELGVVLAPPERGKSQLLTFMARNMWLKGKGVVYVSMEMGEDDIMMRLYAGLVGMDSNDIPFKTEKVLERLKKIVPKNPAAFVIKRYPSKGVTVEGICAFVREVKKTCVIDVVLVDYGDIVAAPKQYDNRVDEQALVYEQLRAMGIEFGIPIWTASQSNRLSWDKSVVTVAHVADSWDKVKIADYIIAISQTKDEKANQMVRLIFAKCRHNAPGEPIHCEIEYDKAVFREVEPPDID